MTATITVRLDTGEVYEADADDWNFVLTRGRRKVTCKHVPMCDFAHRKPSGPKRLTIRAKIKAGGWNGG